MNSELLNLIPKQQAKAILIFGLILTITIFYALTNQFNGVKIPKDYEVLIGK